MGLGSGDLSDNGGAQAGAGRGFSGERGFGGASYFSLHQRGTAPVARVGVGAGAMGQGWGGVGFGGWRPGEGGRGGWGGFGGWEPWAERAKRGLEDEGGGGGES